MKVINGALAFSSGWREIINGLLTNNYLNQELINGAQSLPSTVSGDPLDDYLAVLSVGLYPNPLDSPSAAERAYFAVSYGLLGTL